jgi:UDP-glucose 4-epimerase
MQMKVLVTGGSGNIGEHVALALLEKGYDVAIFDRCTARIEGVSDVRIGDLRDAASVVRALEGIDAVIHLAAVLPPLSEQDPALAEAVNVDGTRHLIGAMERMSHCRRLIFASTTAVHGSRLNRKYPISANEPFDPPDGYARQKLAGEELTAASSLDWTILRVPAVPPTKIGKGPPGGVKLLVKIPADCRIEVLHPTDAGTAFANAVACRETFGRRLLLGGGAQNGCQVSGYEFACAITNAVGIGALPRSLFGTDPGGAHAEWLDASESERLLKYQNHSLQDLMNELRKSFGALYYLTRLLSPLVRFGIIQAVSRDRRSHA